MNGGLGVDVWGQTSLAGCYAIGEAAGTHGITRPGGAALNAGQVMGTRCAEHIASRPRPRDGVDPSGLVSEAVSRSLAILRGEGGLAVESIAREVQSRMSDHAGILCTADGVASALADARRLNASIRSEGIAHDGAYRAARAFQWAQMALVSEAVLAALSFYVDRGGGSRGARAILGADGECTPSTRRGPLQDYRFVAERDEDRREQISTRFHDRQFTAGIRAVRRRDDGERPFFERNWPEYLTGEIYDTPPRS
jgi:hypothetical protein